MRQLTGWLNHRAVALLSGFIFFFSFQLMPSHAEAIQAFNINNLGRAGIMEPVSEGVEREQDRAEGLKIDYKMLRAF